MALPFNPFEKKLPKKQYTKVKVYENAPVEEIKNDKPLENHKETNNQSIITKPLENQSSIIHQSIINDEPIISQLIDKSIDKPLINNQKTIKQELSSVVGNEAQLLIFLVEECVKKRELKTGRIITDVLKSRFSLNANGVANLIFRVKEKGLLDILEQKLGRVSYRVFSVPKEVYNYYLNPENHHEIIKKPLEKPLENTSNHDHSSNSELINLNINTNEAFNFLIPENLKTIGVGNRQLLSILNLKVLSAEEIQSSLDHYSYDLLSGTRPNLNLLMGILRRGSVYISQKYSQTLSNEIENELARIEKVKEQEKEIKKNQMYVKYQEYKNNNSKWYEDLKAQQRFQVSEEIFDSIAFTKFCEEIK